MQRLTCFVRLAALILLPFGTVLARKPLAVVEIASCNAFSGNVAALAQMIDKPFIAMSVNGWLSKATSCPHLAGVDVNQPLRLIIWPGATMGRPPERAAILPLLDQGDILRDALRGVYNQAVSQDDILALTGAQAGIQRGDLFVAFVGKLAVTGPNRATVAETVAALKAGTLPVVAPISGTLRATMDIQALAAFLEGEFKRRSADRERLRSKIVLPPGQPNPVEIMDLQQSTLLAILRQTRSFSVGLSADADGVTLYSRVDPVPQSTAAQLFARHLPIDPRYRALLPANPLFAQAGSGLDGRDLLVEPYVKFTDLLHSKMGAPFSAFGPITRQSFMASKGVYKGPYALAVNASPDGRGVELVMFAAVKDEQAARHLQLNSVTNMLALFKSGTEKGFNLQFGAPRKSGEVEIQTFRHTLNTPAGLTPPLPVATILSWVNPLSGESAVAHGHIVTALGSSNDVSRVMDRALASLKNTPVSAAGPKICALFPEIQATPATEWHLSPSDVLRLVLGATGRQADARKLASLPPRGAGVGGIALLQGDALLGSVRLSASELRSLTQSFKILRKSGWQETDAEPRVTPPVPPTTPIPAAPATP